MCGEMIWWIILVWSWGGLELVLELELKCKFRKAEVALVWLERSLKTVSEKSKRFLVLMIVSDWDVNELR